MAIRDFDPVRIARFGYRISRLRNLHHCAQNHLRFVFDLVASKLWRSPVTNAHDARSIAAPSMR